jgi:uncharacterized protein YgbK (DUF1537 family)
MNRYASRRKPLFWVGSSGVETALSAQWARERTGARMKTAMRRSKDRRGPVLIGSGSCSPVTSGQIQLALRRGFVEVALDARALRISDFTFQGIVAETVAHLRAGRSVIVHTTRDVAHAKILQQLGSRSAAVLGSALGLVLREVLEQTCVRRVCIAGGDTSSHAARALGIEALEMIAPLTPGAPVCKAHAAGSPADQCEFVFKGGQVGAENYFEML